MHEECNETWVDIPDTNGAYQASDKGRVRSVYLGIATGRQRGRVISPATNRKGYLVMRLCVPGHKSRTQSIHRIIARTFIGKCPDGFQVNHKDGDKKNNTPSNLEYVTCLENIQHCWNNGLHGAEHCRGEKNNKAKLTADNVIAIRCQSQQKSLAELAKDFGVTKQAIWHIVQRKTWKHI